MHHGAPTPSRFEFHLSVATDSLGMPSLLHNLISLSFPVPFYPFRCFSFILPCRQWHASLSKISAFQLILSIFLYPKHHKHTFYFPIFPISPLSLIKLPTLGILSNIPMRQISSHIATHFFRIVIKPLLAGYLSIARAFSVCRPTNANAIGWLHLHLVRAKLLFDLPFALLCRKG